MGVALHDSLSEIHNSRIPKQYKSRDMDLDDDDCQAYLILHVEL